MKMKFLKKRKCIQGIIAIFFCLVFYAFMVAPFWIRVKEVVIIDEYFSGFFRDYKTVFISDIHVSAFGLREKIILRKIEEISPDIIFLGGDYVSWTGDYKKAFEFLSKLKAKVGIFGVLGDADYQNSRKMCFFCHTFESNRKPLPARFLRNETVFLPAGKSQVAVSGIELFFSDNTIGEEILKKKKEYPEIILTHKQIELQNLPDRPVLILSGDTHGGQIYMPGRLWQLLFGEAKGRLRVGMINKGNKRLLVTSGIGTNIYPFRVLSPPEIIFFKGEQDGTSE